MSYWLFGHQRLNISFRSNYRQALFGLSHIAFIDNNNWYVVPVEDRDSLDSALFFYDEKINKLPSYPLYDGKTFFEKKGSDPLVLKQVLGLPDEVFNRLNLKKDILPQITFACGLKDLKKQCYSEVSKPSGKKWFTDDFHQFLLTNGFYFPYDETKPFIEGSLPHLPVFVNMKRISDKMRKLIEEGKSDRFSIDVMGRNSNSGFVDEMKKYDAFSFDDLIDYFVNGIYDLRIADCHPSTFFKDNYSSILRSYFASLINVLYDEFSFKVLNKVTAKLSYMTVSKIETDKQYYVLSSYNGEMYSLDNRNFFFSLADKTRIKNLLEEELSKNRKGDSLSVYSHIGLPYYGYQFVKDLTSVSVSSFLKSLPFMDDISESTLYLSSKRFDSFYDYLSEEKEHLFAFLNRRLNSQGISFISDVPLLNLDKDTKIQLIVRKYKRSPVLSRIFDDKECLLSEEIYLAYLAANHEDKDPVLYELLKKIDEKSNKGAVSYFLYSLDDISLKDAVSQTLLQYGEEGNDYKDVFKVMEFILKYIYLLVRDDYRKQSLDRFDTLSLLALDGHPKLDETYEPNLPYPYVTYGKLCYSFRKSFFSEPYVCQSEKEAILAKIFFLQEEFSKKEPKGSLLARNRFIISNLGLPDNISSLIKPSKDILTQIPFKEGICHICNSTTPTYHENLDELEDLDYNVYQTYIRANSSKNGLFYDMPFDSKYNVGFFVDSLAKKTYSGIIKFDVDKISPLLLPYLKTDRHTIISIISSFFTNDIYSLSFIDLLSSFLSLGSELIYKILFDCDPSLYHYIEENMAIVTRLAFFYKNMEFAASYVIASKSLPLEDTGICLNMEKNPRLPLPYVALGDAYNGYMETAVSDKIYFCECDRDSMSYFIRKMNDMMNNAGISKEMAASIILAQVGLPFLAVLKYGDMDLSLNSVDDLINSIPFRDSICRRCTGINHSAIYSPFTKVFPFKEDQKADYIFAVNGLIHDRVFLIAEIGPDELKYDPHHFYDINGSDDFFLPLFYCPGSLAPKPLFSLFSPSKETLKDELFEFSNKSPDNSEAVAYASGVILDSYEENRNAILDFIVGQMGPSTLKQLVTSCFPKIDRVRQEFMDSAIQAVLGFITFLEEKLMNAYVEKERRIGR